MHVSFDLQHFEGQQRCEGKPHMTPCGALKRGLFRNCARNNTEVDTDQMWQLQDWHTRMQSLIRGVTTIKMPHAQSNWPVHTPQCADLTMLLRRRCPASHVVGMGGVGNYLSAENNFSTRETCCHVANSKNLKFGDSSLMETVSVPSLRCGIYENRAVKRAVHGFWWPRRLQA